MAGAREEVVSMRSRQNLTVLQVPWWKEILWLRHGFSTRWGGVSTAYDAAADTDETSGDLNTGWTLVDSRENVTENRRRLVEKVGGAELSADALITVRQVHSARSLVVRESRRGCFTAERQPSLEADGLMTNLPGQLLGVQTADCVPVLVVDMERRAVAAFHAGWRGTVAGIVERGIAQMSAEFGSRREDLTAAVGPSIGSCCYSVGEEVRDAFAVAFGYADALFEVRRLGRDEKTFLDLWRANRLQLLGAGVAEERIHVAGECTGCMGLPGRRKYFSHRCENGFTGRMMNVIGIAGGRV